MLVLCLMLSVTTYALNYASIISRGLATKNVADNSSYYSTAKDQYSLIEQSCKNISVNHLKTFLQESLS